MLVVLRSLDAGFVVATNPKCRFGAMEVVATVRSHTAMQCYTPVNTDFNPNTVSLYNKQDKANRNNKQQSFRRLYPHFGPWLCMGNTRS